MVQSADHDASSPARNYTINRSDDQHLDEAHRLVPEWPAMAARTARLTNSSTACGSRRRALGIDSNVCDHGVISNLVHRLLVGIDLGNAHQLDIRVRHQLFLCRTTPSRQSQFPQSSASGDPRRCAPRPKSGWRHPCRAAPPAPRRSRQRPAQAAPDRRRRIARPPARRLRARASHARTDAAPRHAPEWRCALVPSGTFLISARRGWPEACTRWVRSVITSMPCSTSPLMTRPTAFSLPGMVREEKMMVSPLLKVTSGCWSSAMRASARAQLALASGAERHHLVGR